MYSDLLLGAYAMAPADRTAEDAFYAGVADLGVGGLELPLPLPGAPSLEPTWLARNVRPEWDLLVTCIPTVMGRLAAEPDYGLASTDESGRAHALEDVARARNLALRLADEEGRRRVVGIQVHSAPGAGTRWDASDGGMDDGTSHGLRDAFARSLEQILSWDLAGAELLVEHCDAQVRGQRAAKGFLPLEDEIAAVRSVTGASAGQDEIGLAINWGRSTIEGRDAGAATRHVRAARDAGLLRALVFSGASDTESAWGPAWGDAHIPARGTDPALAASSASLLGPAEIAATWAAAGERPRVAVKVSVRPKDAGVATRLAVARAALATVDASRPGR